MEFKGDKKKVGLYLSGQQIEVPGANIFITQPTINQIVSFGEDDFLISVGLLAKLENLLGPLKEGNSELNLYSDFQLLMTVLREDISVQHLVRKLFYLIFPDYEVTFEEVGMNFLIRDEEAEKDILVGQIHPYNFETFQTLLCDLFTLRIGDEEDNREFNPVGEAAKEIAKKLERGRKKRAEAQGPQSVFGIYCSTLSVGLGMDVNIFYNYTLFQLCDTYNRFISKIQSDFYSRVSTMPFMDVSKMERPKEWTRHLY